MPRRSATALETLAARLRGDVGLDPEIKANALSRLRGLQRRSFAEDEQDIACALVLLRIDLLTMSGSRTADAINGRLRVSEQLTKLRSALRRSGRPAGVARRATRDMFRPPADVAAPEPAREAARPPGPAGLFGAGRRPTLIDPEDGSDAA
jgi:hypothetical protein